MNRKFIVSVYLINSFLLIKSEDSLDVKPLINQTTTDANSSSVAFSADKLPENNGTNSTRGGRTDLGNLITNIIGIAAAGAIESVGNQVVNQAYGSMSSELSLKTNYLIFSSIDQLIYSGRLCYGSARRDRECMRYCRGEYRTRFGYCRSGICVCECDHYECSRYCRRHDYWDEFDDYDSYDGYDGYDGYDDYHRRRRYPVSRQRRYRDRGYCSLTEGCLCDYKQ